VEPITALVLGGSGLVGRALLHELLAAAEYAGVRALVRRPLEPHPKLETQVIDFDEPSSWGDLLQAQHVFCALGTTLKKAGSEAAFRKIDLDLPLELLRRARERGATALFVVSALGAEPASKVFYYRVKGELERGLKELPDARHLPAVAPHRPAQRIAARRAARRRRCQGRGAAARGRSAQVPADRRQGRSKSHGQRGAHGDRLAQSAGLCHLRIRRHSRAQLC
jgi:hypothetical protein